MTKPRNKMPLESFGSELFNALIEGSKRKVQLQLSYRGAVTLRMRLHQLRQRMREDSHPLYSIAAKTRITISWNEDTIVASTPKNIRYPKDPRAPVTLTLSPHDSEYANVFKDAGLDLKPIDHKLFSPSPGDGEEPIPTLEDLLKDFK